MKEIKATAPTPQDWIELVRENERLRVENERLEASRKIVRFLSAKIRDLKSKLENKVND